MGQPVKVLFLDTGHGEQTHANSWKLRQLRYISRNGSSLGSKFGPRFAGVFISLVASSYGAPLRGRKPEAMPSSCLGITVCDAE